MSTPPPYPPQPGYGPPPQPGYGYLPQPGKMPQRPARRDGIYWWALASAGLIIVGSLGPWAKALGGLLSRDGVDGDGIITLICGVLAIGVLIAEGAGATRSRSLFALCVPLGLVSAIVGIVDIRHLIGTQNPAGTELFGKADQIQPGWGSGSSSSLEAACSSPRSSASFRASATDGRLRVRRSNPPPLEPPGRGSPSCSFRNDDYGRSDGGCGDVRASSG